MAIRALLAVASLVSAAVHYKLWFVDDFSELDVVGPAFLLIVGGIRAARSEGWLGHGARR